MLDKVLYFPYMRVPDNEWFTRVLLYWDEVGSIIPYWYVDRPERLGPRMAKLVESGLVKHINPPLYIRLIPQFDQAFLQFIDANPTIAARRGVPLDQQQTFRIHIEKLGSIAAGLCERGLAKPYKEYSWYEVEDFTARQFMAYLAAALGRVEELGYVPATDDAQSLAVLSSEPEGRMAMLALRERLRVSILQGVLPAPTGGVHVAELSKFKSRYGDQLGRFRRHVESLILGIAESRDPEIGRERVHLAQQELRDQVEELQARMRERNWPRISKGTLCSLVAGTVASTAAIATGNVPGAAAGLIGIAGVVYNAFTGSPQQQEIMRSPLAYAALAQERLA